MLLKDYIKKITTAAKDAQEIEFEVGITTAEGLILVDEDSNNRVSFTYTKSEK